MSVKVGDKVWWLKRPARVVSTSGLDNECIVSVLNEKNVEHCSVWISQDLLQPREEEKKEEKDESNS